MWTVDFLSSNREFIVAYFISVSMIKCGGKGAESANIYHRQTRFQILQKSKSTVEDARPVVCLESLGAGLLVTRRQLTTLVAKNEKLAKGKKTGFFSSLVLSTVCTAVCHNWK
jgi:hypothetical protein